MSASAIVGRARRYQLLVAFGHAPIQLVWAAAGGAMLAEPELARAIDPPLVLLLGATCVGSGVAGLLASAALIAPTALGLHEAGTLRWVARAWWALAASLTVLVIGAAVLFGVVAAELP